MLVSHPASVVGLFSFIEPLVRRFANDVVGPKVRDMDEKEMMAPDVIKGLFEQGVSHTQLVHFLRRL